MLYLYLVLCILASHVLLSTLFESVSVGLKSTSLKITAALAAASKNAKPNCPWKSLIVAHAGTEVHGIKRYLFILELAVSPYVFMFTALCLFVSVNLNSTGTKRHPCVFSEVHHILTMEKVILTKSGSL